MEKEKTSGSNRRDCAFSSVVERRAEKHFGAAIRRFEATIDVVVDNYRFNSLSTKDCRVILRVVFACCRFEQHFDERFVFVSLLANELVLNFRDYNGRGVNKVFSKVSFITS
jgi:hypothetical protein